ncbi:hypothetical protein QTO34_011558, partial [Cnephaeus nilssonii]
MGDLVFALPADGCFCAVPGGPRRPRRLVPGGKPGGHGHRLSEEADQAQGSPRLSQARLQATETSPSSRDQVGLTEEESRTDACKNKCGIIQDQHVLVAAKVMLKKSRGRAWPAGLGLGRTQHPAKDAGATPVVSCDPCSSPLVPKAESLGAFQALGSAAPSSLLGIAGADPQWFPEIRAGSPLVPKAGKALGGGFPSLGLRHTPTSLQRLFPVEDCPLTLSEPYFTHASAILAHELLDLPQAAVNECLPLYAITDPKLPGYRPARRGGSHSTTLAELPESQPNHMSDTSHPGLQAVTPMEPPQASLLLSFSILSAGTLLPARRLDEVIQQQRLLRRPTRNSSSLTPNFPITTAYTRSKLRLLVASCCNPAPPPHLQFTLKPSDFTRNETEASPAHLPSSRALPHWSLQSLPHRKDSHDLFSFPPISAHDQPSPEPSTPKGLLLPHCYSESELSGSRSYWLLHQGFPRGSIL